MDQPPSSKPTGTFVSRLLGPLARGTVGALGYQLVPRHYRGDPLRDHLQDLIRIHGINCVLDVGAHTGEYTHMLREHGYTGKIVSFEPMPDHYRPLERLAELDPDWQVQGVALGDCNEPAALKVTAHPGFTSLLEPNEYCHQWSAGESQVSRIDMVPVRRLDTLWPELICDQPDARALLKIDTQGFEPQVLAGARDILDRVAVIQCEVAVKPLYEGAEDYRTMIAHLEELGFGLTGLFPCAQELDLRIIEFDCVVARRPAPFTPRA